MSKITITLRDEKKRTELLELLTALPYVASAHWDVAEEAANGHYAQAMSSIISSLRLTASVV